MENQKTRRLAAIMFTDIVGYTALMQQNENAAAEVRAHHREEFEQYHKKYHGEIVQYFGDGTLSVFQSGVEAVECAIEIQKALQVGEPVPLRIGLHLGDIVFDGTDIYEEGKEYFKPIKEILFRNLKFSMSHGSDFPALKKVPKLGQKKSQQIILDLKDKINKLEIVSDNCVSTENYSNIEEELIMALEGLGYNKKDIEKLIDKEEIKNYKNIQEAIKGTLRKI